MPLPFGLRNAVTLFELEIAERVRQVRPPHAQFVGAVDYAPASVHDLLEGESCDSSSESSPDEDSHPLWHCNMVHAAGVDPTGEAGDEAVHPPVLHTPEEQAAYEWERAERAQARATDEEHERTE